MRLQTLSAMANEDLSAPLGLGKRRFLRLPFGLIGIGIVSVFATVALIWIGIVDDPLGGEPTAVIPLSTADGLASRDIEVVEIRPAMDGELGPSLRKNGGDQRLGPRYELMDQEALNAAAGGLPNYPDPRVSERTGFGFLPRIGSEGVRPLDAYARPFETEFASTPKIAIVITGLGLSEAGTQNVLDQLPADTTLGLSPYGANLDRWIQGARTKGHEIVLSLPMEPFDFPDNDPGPHTLLVSLTQSELTERLTWLLTRITNYVGVMPEMGARYTSTRPTLQLLMEKLRDRGLMFVDNGTSSRSVADEIAEETTTPFSGVDVVLDAVPREDEINAKLLQLEGIARARGVAVATGSALPVTVRQIEKWARDLEERGLLLVPVSATIDR
ncbi:conserved hypothetical protein [Roseibium sp. TrichSKD4]|nr:conserved hypothetical protein [Roseibium sp. TrichSKD4]